MFYANIILSDNIRFVGEYPYDNQSFGDPIKEWLSDTENDKNNLF